MSIVVPVPSCPSALSPQHRTVLSNVTTHVWPHPAAAWLTLSGELQGSVCVVAVIMLVVVAGGVPDTAVPVAVAVAVAVTRTVAVVARVVRARVVAVGRGTRVDLGRDVVRVDAALVCDRVFCVTRARVVPAVVERVDGMDRVVPARLVVAVTLVVVVVEAEEEARAVVLLVVPRLPVVVVVDATARRVVTGRAVVAAFVRVLGVGLVVVPRVVVAVPRVVVADETVRGVVVALVVTVLVAHVVAFIVAFVVDAGAARVVSARVVGCGAVEGLADVAALVVGCLVVGSLVVVRVVVVSARFSGMGSAGASRSLTCSEGREHGAP